MNIVLSIDLSPGYLYGACNGTVVIIVMVYRLGKCEILGFS